MVEECHRCGADLDPGSGSFCCPHCGSPQLHIAPAISEGSSPESTGAAPPPKPPELNWRSALVSGMLVAVVGAVLFAVASYVPALTIASLLWIVGAASIAIGVYRRRQPSLAMNGSVGARIGLSVGLLMSSFLSVALAGVGLVARFGTHSMGAFDAEMTQRMQQQVEKAIAANPAPAEVVQQMLSREFRTGVILAGLLVFALLILALSIVGGYVTGMAAAGRKSTA